jgi:hypothetical protein
MTRRAIPLLILLAASLVLLGSASKARIADQRLTKGFEPREFKKLIVVGISEDLRARKTFENQFVSHLKGRGIGAVTSYSLVPDLMTHEDDEAVVDEIRALEIDGAITVRLVPLVKPLTQETWVARWVDASEKDGDLRDLIDFSLPVADTQAGSFGVEVALWETETWDRVWAGRIDPASRKVLRKNSGTFVQSVMDVLTNRKLL